MRKSWDLVVWPTRAAKRESVQARGAACAWTFDELCERLCAWAAFTTASTRDDHAAHLLAHRVLASEAPQLAAALNTFRWALVNAGSSARELVAALADDVDHASGDVDELRRWGAWALRVDEALQNAGLVDGPQLLERARSLLAAGRRPAFLRGVGRIRVEQPLSATTLQAGVLAALSRHVPVAVALPVGHAGGHGAGDDIAALFRRHAAAVDGSALEIAPIDVVGDGPLTSLREALLTDAAVDGDVAATVRFFVDEHEELAFVVDAVAARRSAQPGERVAVAAPGASRVRAFVDALEERGIAVSERRRTLRDSPAGRLLLDVLALRLDGVPRDRLLSVLVSDARRGGLSVDAAVAAWSVLRRAGARSDIDDDGAPAGGYRDRLQRLATRAPPTRSDVVTTLAALGPVLDAVARLPPSASLAAHASALRVVAEEIVDERASSGGAAVLHVVRCMAAAAERISGPADDVAVSLRAVMRALDGAFAMRAWLDDGEYAPACAVEVLPVAELVGRRFDHVVLAGSAAFSLPVRSSIESSVQSLAAGEHDHGAAAIVAARSALRLATAANADHASTSWWSSREDRAWLSAVTAATRSLLVTSSTRDEHGLGCAAGPWSRGIARALGGSVEALVRGEEVGESVVVDPSPVAGGGRVWRSALRAAARRGVDDDAAHDERTLLWARVVADRARWSSVVGDDAQLARRRGPFAFAVDGRRVARVFGHALGLRAERPLTPPRLESLVGCRLRGFVENVLRVDVEHEPDDALSAGGEDALVRDVLQRFERELRARRVPMDRMNDGDRTRLLAAVDEEAARFVAGGGARHRASFRASIAALKTTLLRAVVDRARRPLIADVEPAAFDLHIGDVRSGRAADLAAVPFAVDERRTIFLGTTIDRVDEGAGGRVVIARAPLRGLRLRRHAQGASGPVSDVPSLVALRLLEHHRPTTPATPLYGQLLAATDGAVGPGTGHPTDLRSRVVDDPDGRRDDGLSHAIRRAVLPILDGTIPPDPGPHCGDCRVRRVCRVVGDGPTEDDAPAGARP